MLFQSKNHHSLSRRLTSSIAALLLTLNSQNALSQTTETDDAPAKKEQEVSMMEIVNGSSIPAISLMIEGMGEHENVPQGARISGGAFPLTKWTLRARPRGSDDKRLVEEKTFQSKIGSSSTAVVIGDFVLAKENEGEKPELHASILYLSNEFRGQKKPNRLTIVNGIPEKRIEVAGDGISPKSIETMNLFEWNSLPVAIKPTVKVDGVSLKLPVEFLPPISAVVIVIYLQDGKPSFVAAPQSTLQRRGAGD